MSSKSENDEGIPYRMQLQVSHPLHDYHAVAFIDSLNTLQRQFMHFEKFTNSSITRNPFLSTGIFNCNGCDTPSSGPSHHCLYCQFSLESECAELPLINIVKHPHPLLLLKRKTDHQDLICFACDQEIEASSFTRCVQCDVFMHNQCSLPMVILIKNHHHHDHPVVLLNPGFVDQLNLSCGVCGGERDSVSWIYSCPSCRFVAHVQCVIYDHEVPSRTEIERTIANQFALLILDEIETHEDEDEEQEQEINQELEIKPGITLHQILNSLSESEAAEYEAIGTTMAGEIGDDSETDYETKYLNHFSYIEKPLYDLLEKIDFGDDSDSDHDGPFQGLDMDSRTVFVDQYLIVQTMEKTFARILAKHGDITGTSNFSPNVKIMVCNFFCKVVDEMSKTEIENLTEIILVTWMFGIRTIQLTGFKVQFAFDHWKKLAFAFFGLHGKSMADNFLNEMDREMEELRVKMEKMSGKREEFVNMMEDCLKDGLVMEGKHAANGLI